MLYYMQFSFLPNHPSQFLKSAVNTPLLESNKEKRVRTHISDYNFRLHLNADIGLDLLIKLFFSELKCGSVTENNK